LGIAQEFTGIEEEDVVKEDESFTRVVSAGREDFNDGDEADAMDYADIDEMAEDEEQKEKHYQLGKKYIDNKAMITGDTLIVE